jgi:hypothetical protein
VERTISFCTILQRLRYQHYTLEKWAVCALLGCVEYLYTATALDSKGEITEHEREVAV